MKKGFEKLRESERERERESLKRNKDKDEGRGRVGDVTGLGRSLQLHCRVSLLANIAITVEHLLQFETSQFENQNQNGQNDRR